MNNGFIYFLVELFYSSAYLTWPQDLSISHDFLIQEAQFFFMRIAKNLRQGEQLTTSDLCVEKRLRILKKVFNTFANSRVWARIRCASVRTLSNGARYSSTWGILEASSLASRCVHITWRSFSRCSCFACTAQKNFH